MRRGFITGEQALALADGMGKSSYGAYLRHTAADFLAEQAG